MVSKTIRVALHDRLVIPTQSGAISTLPDGRCPVKLEVARVQFLEHIRRVILLRNFDQPLLVLRVARVHILVLAGIVYVYYKLVSATRYCLPTSLNFFEALK